MSHIKPELLTAIAETCGVKSLHPEAASVLAPDVEYRVRDILQEALKFAHHARNSKLCVADINAALQLRDVEPLYGFSSHDTKRFTRTTGATDVFYVEEALHKCEDLVYEALPSAPVDVGVVAHWFLIDGVRPHIPENTPVKVRGGKKPALVVHVPDAPPPAAATKGGHVVPSTGGAPVEQEPAAWDKDGNVAALTPVMKHVVSEEQQEYMRLVASVLTEQPPPDGGLQHPIFASLAADAGLEQLVPYLVRLIATETNASLKNLPKLRLQLQTMRALIINTSNNLENYLQELLPCIMTCLVSKKLGSPHGNHWEVRSLAARCLRDAILRFSQPVYKLQARVCKQLLAALMDDTRALTTHYGAIQGLSALGPAVTRKLLMPVAGIYYRKLVPVLAQTSKLVKRAEAMRCHGALQLAVCTCSRDMLTRVTDPSVDPLVLHKLQALSQRAPFEKRQFASRQQVRQARLTAMDTRVQELEEEERVIQVERDRLLQLQQERAAAEATEAEAAAEAAAAAELAQAEAEAGAAAAAEAAATAAAAAAATAAANRRAEQMAASANAAAAYQQQLQRTSNDVQPMDTVMKRQTSPQLGTASTAPRPHVFYSTPMHYPPRPHSNPGQVPVLHAGMYGAPMHSNPQYNNANQYRPPYMPTTTAPQQTFPLPQRPPSHYNLTPAASPAPQATAVSPAYPVSSVAPANGSRTQATVAHPATAPAGTAAQPVGSNPHPTGTDTAQHTAAFPSRPASTGYNPPPNPAISHSTSYPQSSQPYAASMQMFSPQQQYRPPIGMQHTIPTQQYAVQPRPHHTNIQQLPTPHQQIRPTQSQHGTTLQQATPSQHLQLPLQTQSLQPPFQHPTNMHHLGATPLTTQQTAAHRPTAQQPQPLQQPLKQPIQQQPVVVQQAAAAVAPSTQETPSQQPAPDSGPMRSRGAGTPSSDTLAHPVDQLESEACVPGRLRGSGAIPPPGSPESALIPSTTASSPPASTAIPPSTCTVPAPSSTIPSSSTSPPSAATMPIPSVTVPTPATAIPTPSTTVPSPICPHIPTATTTIPAPSTSIPNPSITSALSTSISTLSTSIPPPSTLIPPPSTTIPPPSTTHPSTPPGTPLPTPDLSPHLSANPLPVPSEQTSAGVDDPADVKAAVASAPLHSTLTSPSTGAAAATSFSAMLEMDEPVATDGLPSTVRMSSANTVGTPSPACEPTTWTPTPGTTLAHVPTIIPLPSAHSVASEANNDAVASTVAVKRMVDLTDDGNAVTPKAKTVKCRPLVEHSSMLRVPPPPASTMSVWDIDSKTIEVLETAWHDDMDLGPHLEAAFDMFGEALLPWLPVGPLMHCML